MSILQTMEKIPRKSKLFSELKSDKVKRNVGNSKDLFNLDFITAARPHKE